jgi:putative hydrolase of the HAD superfamily
MIPLLRPRTYKAIIFDLFDTLVPSPRGDVWDRMADRMGAPKDTFRTLWGRDARARTEGKLSFEESLGRFCAETGMTVTAETLADLKAIRLEAVRESLAAPLETTVETLEAVRERGFRMGLLSNCSEEVPPAWGESALARWMDAAVFSCVEKVAKPDALAFWRACERLGVSPGECVFVGDGNDNELTGAAALGLAPVQILTSRAPQYVAHYHIARLEEMLTFVGLPTGER